jgi:hypothetical protein
MTKAFMLDIPPSGTWFLNPALVDKVSICRMEWSKWEKIGDKFLN